MTQAFLLHKSFSKRTARLVIGVIGLTLLSFATRAQQGALESEIQEYMQIFSGANFAAQRNAIEPLGWAGISDPRLFDLVADKLRAAVTGESKLDKERASWFAKALALSGNEKYRPLLEETANTAPKKVRKHAKIALERLPKYAQWNPVIARGLATNTGDIDVARVQNMLAAEDSELFRIGAKRVYYAHSANTGLVATVAARLAEDYLAAAGDDDIDSMAWAIKVLAQSGDASHRPLLEEIAVSRANKKIRKYAKKYKEYF